MICNEMKYCISRRGIGLLKDDLSAQEQEEIRTELTVRPYLPPTAIQKPSSFPIYRESDKKMYVPKWKKTKRKYKKARFYRFGPGRTWVRLSPSHGSDCQLRNLYDWVIRV